MRALGLMAHGWPVHQVMGVGNLKLVGELNKLFDVMLGMGGESKNSVPRIEPPETLGQHLDLIHL